MGTPAARALHLALFFTGFVLYVVFVLPRWWVLTGDIPPTLATTGRIAAGIPIGLAAIPVIQILQAALRSKQHTPELALRLRAWSAVLHGVAGTLILLAAIAEFWVTLQAGGPWLFAVYGAAGAIAGLGCVALYLSFVAEKPPAEPKSAKPAKAKKSKAEKKARTGAKPRTKRGRKARRTADSSDDSSAADSGLDVPPGPEDEPTGENAEPPAAQSAESAEAVADESGADGAGSGDAASQVATEDATAPDETVSEGEGAEQPTGLRNKRPTGKRRHRMPR